jgi:hypothetical protein
VKRFVDDLVGRRGGGCVSRCCYATGVLQFVSIGRFPLNVMLNGAGVDLARLYVTINFPTTHTQPSGLQAVRFGFLVSCVCKG